MYENTFTRQNPGLIIFLVDQSKSMGDIWCNGKTLAEHVALSINRCISEMALTFTKGTMIKDSANIVILGYGGIDGSNMNPPFTEAELLLRGSIATLCNDTSIPIQHLKQTISDGAGGITQIDFDLKEFIKPKAVWDTPMASAFCTASSIVKEWVEGNKTTTDEDGKTIYRDDCLDPVPLIINISDGEPNPNSEADVRKYAKEIMETACPDGNPLIFNIHLSTKGGQEISLPKDASVLPTNDNMSKLLFDISSVLPEGWVQKANEKGFPNAEVGAKAFMSNVSKVEEFVRFLNFGTLGATQGAAVSGTIR